MNEQIQSLAELYYKNPSDQVVFSKLYKLTRPILLGLSKGILKDSMAAEDNVSEVFMRVIKDTNFIFDPLKDYLSYLRTVASNGAKQMFKKKKRMNAVLTYESNYNQPRDDDFTDNKLDYLRVDAKDNVFEVEIAEMLHYSNEMKCEAVLNLLSKSGNEVLIAAILSRMDPDDMDIFKDVMDKCGLDTALVTSNGYKDIVDSFGLNIGVDKRGSVKTGVVKTRVFRGKRKIQLQIDKLIAESLSNDDITKRTKKNVNGDVCNYYDGGGVKEKFSYRNNLRHGPYRYYHQNGQLGISGNYKNGVTIGRWESFNEDGIADNVIIYSHNMYWFENYFIDGNTEESGLVELKNGRVVKVTNDITPSSN